MTTWLQYLVAYRPAYGRGMLLDGPYRLGAARMRERAASDHRIPATLMTPPTRADIDTMSGLPASLEPTP